MPWHRSVDQMTILGVSLCILSSLDKVSSAVSHGIHMTSWPPSSRTSPLSLRSCHKSSRTRGATPLEDSRAGSHSCSAKILPQPKKIPSTSIQPVLIKVCCAGGFMWKFAVGLVSGPLCPVEWPRSETCEPQRWAHGSDFCNENSDGRVCRGPQVRRV